MEEAPDRHWRHSTSDIGPWIQAQCATNQISAAAAADPIDSRHFAGDAGGSGDSTAIFSKKVKPSVPDPVLK